MKISGKSKEAEDIYSETAKDVESAALNPKIYSYLTDDTYEDKKSKRHKKYVIKRKLKFEDQTHCLEANQLENKTNNWKKNKQDID